MSLIIYLIMDNKHKILEKRLKSLSSSIDNNLWDQWFLVDSYDIKSLKLPNFDIEKWCSHTFNENFNSCLCSKYPLQILNFMKNSYTNEKCIIGSCCIKKFADNKIKNEMK